MTKPTIAILSHYSSDKRMLGANHDYCSALQYAGANPIIIPIGTPIEDIIHVFDGLLVPGGRDLDPKFYRQSEHPTTIKTTLEIDETELNAIRLFATLNKPIMGICRGLQSINVAFGGTLIQDIPSTLLNAINHDQTSYQPTIDYHDTAHSIQCNESTLLHSILGEKTEVNSFHHQAIDKLAPNFKVSARSDDGIIEGIELNDRLFAVQWHPERLIDSQSQKNLFVHFVQTCIKKS